MERRAHFRMSFNTDCSERLGPNTSVWLLSVGKDNPSDPSRRYLASSQQL